MNSDLRTSIEGSCCHYSTNPERAEKESLDFTGKAKPSPGRGHIGYSLSSHPFHSLEATALGSLTKAPWLADWLPADLASVGSGSFSLSKRRKFRNPNL